MNSGKEMEGLLNTYQNPQEYENNRSVPIPPSYSYWTRTKPMQHLTCWIGLDDMSTENGCLYYVPGSHKWGLLDKPDRSRRAFVLNVFADGTLSDSDEELLQTVPSIPKEERMDGVFFPLLNS